MATHLTEGQKAPLFKGIDQNGKLVSLTDYKGKNVVLYFYPQDDTPTCTVQACNLRDNYSLLKQHGLEVIGISPDDVTRHQEFEKKYNLPFTLITDPKKKIIEKYGVWGEKSLYGRKYIGLRRTTFIINESGKIKKIFSRPRSNQHAEEIIKSLTT